MAAIDATAYCAGAVADGLACTGLLVEPLGRGWSRLLGAVLVQRPRDPDDSLFYVSKVPKVVLSLLTRGDGLLGGGAPVRPYEMMLRRDTILPLIQRSVDVVTEGRAGIR